MPTQKSGPKPRPARFVAASKSKPQTAAQRAATKQALSKQTRGSKQARTKQAASTPAQSAHKYETVALVLQGGGALGSYQCGVYEGLRNAGIEPNWFAGISIGAINAAILAGNAPEHRLERLRRFWERIAVPAVPMAKHLLKLQERELNSVTLPSSWLAWADTQGALAALLFGQSGFFVPRPLLAMAGLTKNIAETSFYSTAPLKSTLEEFIDFDRINAADVRFSVGAVNVRSGNFAYFDNYGDNKVKVRAEHVMASGALPPAFAAVEIDGEHYWDGGMVSNTPLDHVLGAAPRRDSLVFQVDLWRAQGILPRNLMEVAERQKDIQYSSRTRYSTKLVKDWQDMRTTLNALLKEIPPDHVTAKMRAELEPWLSDRVYNVIHLIYRSKPFEEQYKDYAFAPTTMREHWNAGLCDMQETIAHPEFFAPPSRRVGAITHDVHRARNG